MVNKQKGRPFPLLRLESRAERGKQNGPHWRTGGRRSRVSFSDVNTPTQIDRSNTWKQKTTTTRAMQAGKHDEINKTNCKFLLLTPNAVVTGIVNENSKEM